VIIIPVRLLDRWEGVLKNRSEEMYYRLRTHVPATEKMTWKTRARSRIHSISEETAREKGKGAKNGSGFSTVRFDSTPFAQNRSRKNVTLGANSGQFSLAK
jgi:hypothetical protein